MENKKKTVAFIDAANLFYGGRDALTWKVDYESLSKYLKERYDVEIVYFFGGLEIYGFPYDQITNETLPLENLKSYLNGLVKKSHELTKKERFALLEHPLKSVSVTLSRIKFYQKLEKFGYKLNTKPIKTYYNGDESPRRKRNCDVDMAFFMLKDENQFERCLVLSGDGDFLPVLKYLRSCGKEVLVLARGIKTAKEIKQFAGDTFLEFDNLREFLEQKEDIGDAADDGS
ncbi:NYN domain-containing protein [Candidatus Nomurabacteria bacterium]|nr:NYN domain-containing protein [Candidatus Nomurabacteria bacterium]